MSNRLKLGISKISRFFHSVRFRLSLWYLAILTLALLIFGVAIYSIEERTLSGPIDAGLNAAAEQLAKVVTNQNDQLRMPFELGMFLQQLSSRNIPQEVLGRLIEFPGAKSLFNGRYMVLLVNSQNQVTQQFGPLAAADLTRLKPQIATQLTKTEPNITSFELAHSPELASDDKNVYRVLFYPLKDTTTGTTYGMLVVGLWWEGANTLYSLFWTLALVGLVTLVFTAGGGFWLAARAMRPVNQITHTARIIGETDLSRRINLKRQDELGELAATFDSMLNRLENAFARQRQFTADASHELRTPLTIINLEVSRMLSRRRTAQEYEQALSIVQTENDYMTQLVNDLLLLARADSGQISLKFEQLDLSDLALETVERLTPLANSHKIELILGDLPELNITGNKLYLMRSLANLVENAIKYTAGYGRQVEITTGRQQIEKREWVWVRIADDGPGIAPAHLPHLFDRFYQADAARQASPAPILATSASALNPATISSNSKGSGLGLSIVQWIVQLHQGKVQVSSEPGKGATFEIWLPVSKTTFLTDYEQ